MGFGDNSYSHQLEIYLAKLRRSVRGWIIGIVETQLYNRWRIYWFSIWDEDVTLAYSRVNSKVRAFFTFFLWARESLCSLWTLPNDQVVVIAVWLHYQLDIWQWTKPTERAWTVALPYLESRRNWTNCSSTTDGALMDFG